MQDLERSADVSGVRPIGPVLLRFALAPDKGEGIHRLEGGYPVLPGTATAMEDDENWPEDMALRRARYSRHHTGVGNAAEGRWYISVVVASHALSEDRIGPPEHLLAAASCYARTHRLMWDVWRCAGGIGGDDAKVIQGTRPEARRRIAALLREARDVDAVAAEHLERAISA